MPEDPESRRAGAGPVDSSAGRQKADGSRARSALSSLRRSGSLVIGRLIEHGRAHYQFRSNENPSYYVKLLTSQGTKTLWGKDLERALSSGETQPKIGDLIGARRAGREAVTIASRERRQDGRVLKAETTYAHRTRWVVEKVQFFAERARLARRVRDDQVDIRKTVEEHPELKSTFLSVRAAEEFAARRIPNPEDRARFVALMREAIAASIQKGEPLPAVRMRSPAKERAPVPPNRNRDEPTR